MTKRRNTVQIRMMRILTVLSLCLALPAQAQIISIDALGGSGADPIVSVDVLGSAANDQSLLSLEVLGADSLLNLGLSGQDILLLGAPASDLLSGARDGAVDPLLNVLRNGDSTVLEFLQDTANAADLVPEVLTLELSLSPESATDAAPESEPYGSPGDPDAIAAPQYCDDEDRDGVCDVADSCPNTPANSPVLPSGCHLAADHPLELRGVRFATDSALMTANSEEVLRRAAQLLLAQPALRIEIGVHTDDMGLDAANMRLSTLRAETVMVSLVAEGVPRARLSVKGYAARQPKIPVAGLSGAALKNARAENRRVVLRVIGSTAAAR